ncbi:MAG: DUF488 family protein [Burkholderiales bacterium]
MILWTIGHSTRTAQEFSELLGAHGIEQLIDVRRFASSRRHPQFSRDTLRNHLAANTIGYVHLPELGGRREPKPDSINIGWREPGFRGYADYMQTAAFESALLRLVDAAAGQPSAMMCAEANWRSCHRGLVADALKVRGIEVIHIADSGKTEAHPFTKPARIEAGALTYAAPPPAQQQLGL